MVDLLDPEELRTVVGHELGHVLSGHAVYRTMLYNLINLARRIAWMPIGYLGLRGVIWALEEWYRKSELSCDRAGLLASQDVDAARRVLMKLAGGSRMSELSADAFHEQAHEYDAVPDVRDGLLKILQLQGNTHPFAVVRFAELDRWAASGEYERILSGDYLRRDSDSTATIADEVRAAAKSYQESSGSCAVRRRAPCAPARACSAGSAAAATTTAIDVRDHGSFAAVHAASGPRS
jgi:hypothetical protein